MGANNPRDINPKLLAPFVRKLLRPVNEKFIENSSNNKPLKRTNLEIVGSEDDIRFASGIDLKSISKAVD